MRTNLEMTLYVIERFLEEADKMNSEHRHIMKWMLISALIKELEAAA
jgi:hypothetical protein